MDINTCAAEVVLPPGMTTSAAFGGAVAREAAAIAIIPRSPRPHTPTLSYPPRPYNRAA